MSVNIWEDRVLVLNSNTVAQGIFYLRVEHIVGWGASHHGGSWIHTTDGESWNCTEPPDQIVHFLKGEPK